MGSWPVLYQKIILTSSGYPFHPSSKLLGIQGRFFIKEERTMRERKMRMTLRAAVVVLCLGLSACASAPMSQSQKAEEVESVRDMASQTLALLYKANPAAEGAIANSAGYAVFSDFGFKLMFMGGERGAGIAVNNATKQETFMKMVEL